MMLGLFTVELLGAENRIRVRLSGVKHFITLYPESVAGRDGAIGLPWTIQRQIEHQLNIPKRILGTNVLFEADHPTKEGMKIPVIENRIADFSQDDIDLLVSLCAVCFDEIYNKNAMIRCDRFNEVIYDDKRITPLAELPDELKALDFIRTPEVKQAYLDSLPKPKDEIVSVEIVPVAE